MWVGCVLEDLGQTHIVQPLWKYYLNEPELVYFKNVFPPELYQHLLKELS